MFIENTRAARVFLFLGKGPGGKGLLLKKNKYEGSEVGAGVGRLLG